MQCPGAARCPMPMCPAKLTGQSPLRRLSSRIAPLRSRTAPIVWYAPIPPIRNGSAWNMPRLKSGWMGHRTSGWPGRRAPPGAMVRHWPNTSLLLMLADCAGMRRWCVAGAAAITCPGDSNRFVRPIRSKRWRKPSPAASAPVFLLLASKRQSLGRKARFARPVPALRAAPQVMRAPAWLVRISPACCGSMRAIASISRVKGGRAIRKRWFRFRLAIRARRTGCRLRI